MRSLIAAITVTLAVAPAALAAERQPPILPVPSCAAAIAPLSGEDPIRPTAETGTIPCPQFLSTTIIKRVRVPQRT